MRAARQRKNSGSPYYHYYRCPTRQIKGRDACSSPHGLRAEETEATVWSFVSSLLKDPERLRAGLRRMIEEERKALCDDPERESKVWLDKIA